MSAFVNTVPAAVGSHAFRAVDPRQIGYFLYSISVCALLAGFFAQDPIAYILVTVPVLMPAFLWVFSGAYGIPVLPVISALFYLYYAMPLLVGNTLAIYQPSDLANAAISVGLFLTAATLAAWPFLGIGRQQTYQPSNRRRAPRYSQSLRARSLSDLASNDEMIRLIFAGLAVGIVYNAALVSGKLDFLGTAIGLVRAAAGSLASVACYLIGFARGSRALTGRRWVMAISGFLIITALSISGLMLVGGALNVAAATLGYVLGAKRIPWRGIGVAFVLVSILNAGKYSMRDAYWQPDSQSVQGASVLRVPGMLANWFVAGVGSLASPSSRRDPSLLERTSLLHMVLTVQAATPTIIPYLDGTTYMLLPLMLVPRFLEPDKVVSQAGLNLLSVRYGRETVEDTNKTTIGWGLVSEAYANFGNPGALAVGALFGILCGFLMRLSATAAPVSLAMLLTIASTMTLCNLESDFSYLLATLFQAMAGTILFAALYRFTRRRPVPAVVRAPKKLR